MGPSAVKTDYTKIARLPPIQMKPSDEIEQADNTTLEVAVKPGRKPIGFWTLFRFSTRTERMLVAISVALAAFSGALLPVTT